MARIVGAERSGIITEPVWLLSIAPGIRYSSGGPISHDGQTWASYDIDISNINPDKHTATVKLGNTLLGIGAIALGDGFADKAIEITSYYDGVANLLVSGVCDGVNVGERWVELTIVPSSTSRMQSPRIPFNSYLFQSLPPAGTVIRWGNEEFTIENG